MDSPAALAAQLSRGRIAIRLVLVRLISHGGFSGLE